jgi:hypothetical protein
MAVLNIVEPLSAKERIAIIREGQRHGIGRITAIGYAGCPNAISFQRSFYMNQVQQILALIGALGTAAGAAGVPFAGLAGTLAPIAGGLISEVAQATGKTRGQIIQETGVELDAEIQALLISESKGE